MIQDNPCTQKNPFLRITRRELENLDYVHRCVAEALIKTGEVVISDTVEVRP